MRETRSAALIVDPDPVTRRALEAVVARAGFAAATAATPAEAIEKFHAAAPALVLLDFAHGPQLLRVFTRRRAAREAEIDAVREVLERARWNHAEAARVLKIRYTTLLQKVSQSGLSSRPGLKRPR